jgi:hypothetical protein
VDFVFILSYLTTTAFSFFTLLDRTPTASSIALVMAEVASSSSRTENEANLGSWGPREGLGWRRLIRGGVVS